MVNGARHDPEAVRRLLAKALAEARGGDAEAVYTARDFGLTRFANSQIHQNVIEHDASIRVRLAQDGRTGVASTNRLDDEGLRDVVSRAMAIRDRAASNPGAPSLPEGVSAPHATFGAAEGTMTADPSMRARTAHGPGRDLTAGRDGPPHGGRSTERVGPAMGADVRRRLATLRGSTSQ